MSQGFLKFTPTPLFIEILFQNNINIGNRKQTYWKQQQQQQQQIKWVGETNHWIIEFYHLKKDVLVAHCITI